LPGSLSSSVMVATQLSCSESNRVLVAEDLETSFGTLSESAARSMGASRCTLRAAVLTPDTAAHVLLIASVARAGATAGPVVGRPRPCPPRLEDEVSGIHTLATPRTMRPLGPSLLLRYEGRPSPAEAAATALFELCFLPEPAADSATLRDQAPRWQRRLARAKTVLESSHSQRTVNTFYYATRDDRQTKRAGRHDVSEA
jgi:hypothetical protein